MTDSTMKLGQPTVERNKEFFLMVQSFFNQESQVVETNLLNYYEATLLDDLNKCEKFRSRTSRMNLEGQSCVLDLIDMQQNQLAGCCGFIKVNRIEKEAQLVFIFYEQYFEFMEEAIMYILKIIRAQKYNLNHLVCDMSGMQENAETMQVLRRLGFVEIKEPNDCKAENPCFLLYTHAPSMVAERPARDSDVGSIQEVCRFWIRGNCKYGSDCRFMHILPASPAGVPSFSSQQHAGGGSGGGGSFNSGPGVGLGDESPSPIPYFVDSPYPGGGVSFPPMMMYPGMAPMAAYAARLGPAAGLPPGISPGMVTSAMMPMQVPMQMPMQVPMHMQVPQSARTPVPVPVSVPEYATQPSTPNMYMQMVASPVQQQQQSHAPQQSLYEDYSSSGGAEMHELSHSMSRSLHLSSNSSSASQSHQQQQGEGLGGIPQAMRGPVPMPMQVPVAAVRQAAIQQGQGQGNMPGPSYPPPLMVPYYLSIPSADDSSVQTAATTPPQHAQRPKLPQRQPAQPRQQSRGASYHSNISGTSSNNNRYADFLDLVNTGFPQWLMQLRYHEAFVRKSPLAATTDSSGSRSGSAGTSASCSNSTGGGGGGSARIRQERQEASITAPPATATTATDHRSGRGAGEKDTAGVREIREEPEQVRRVGETPATAPLAGGYRKQEENEDSVARKEEPVGKSTTGTIVTVDTAETSLTAVTSLSTSPSNSNMIADLTLDLPPTPTPTPAVLTPEVGKEAETPKEVSVAAAVVVEEKYNPHRLTAQDLAELDEYYARMAGPAETTERKYCRIFSRGFSAQDLSATSSSSEGESEASDFEVHEARSDDYTTLDASVVTSRAAARASKAIAAARAGAGAARMAGKEKGPLSERARRRMAQQREQQQRNYRLRWLIRCLALQGRDPSNITDLREQSNVIDLTGAPPAPSRHVIDLTGNHDDEDYSAAPAAASAPAAATSPAAYMLHERKPGTTRSTAFELESTTFGGSEGSADLHLDAYDADEVPTADDASPHPPPEVPLNTATVLFTAIAGNVTDLDAISVQSDLDSGNASVTSEVVVYVSPADVNSSNGRDSQGQRGQQQGLQGDESAHSGPVSVEEVAAAEKTEGGVAVEEGEGEEEGGGHQHSDSDYHRTEEGQGPHEHDREGEADAGLGLDERSVHSVTTQLPRYEQAQLQERHQGQGRRRGEDAGVTSTNPSAVKAFSQEMLTCLMIHRQHRGHFESVPAFLNTVGLVPSNASVESIVVLNVAVSSAYRHAKLEALRQCQILHAQQVQQMQQAHVRYQQYQQQLALQKQVVEVAAQEQAQAQTQAPMQAPDEGEKMPYPSQSYQQQQVYQQYPQQPYQQQQPYHQYPQQVSYMTHAAASTAASASGGAMVDGSGAVVPIQAAAAGGVETGQQLLQQYPAMEPFSPQMQQVLQYQQQQQQYAQQYMQYQMHLQQQQQQQQAGQPNPHTVRSSDMPTTAANVMGQQYQQQLLQQQIPFPQQLHDGATATMNTIAGAYYNTSPGYYEELYPHQYQQQQGLFSAPTQQSQPQPQLQQQQAPVVARDRQEQHQQAAAEPRTRQQQQRGQQQGQQQRGQQQEQGQKPPHTQQATQGRHYEHNPASAVSQAIQQAHASSAQAQSTASAAATAQTKAQLPRNPAASSTSQQPQPQLSQHRQQQQQRQQVQQQRTVVYPTLQTLQQSWAEMPWSSRDTSPSGTPTPSASASASGDYGESNGGEGKRGRGVGFGTYGGGNGNGNKGKPQRSISGQLKPSQVMQRQAGGGGRNSRGGTNTAAGPQSGAKESSSGPSTAPGARSHGTASGCGEVPLSASIGTSISDGGEGGGAGRRKHGRKKHGGGSGTGNSGTGSVGGDSRERGGGGGDGGEDSFT